MVVSQKTETTIKGLGFRVLRGVGVKGFKGGLAFRV